jgi:hypothetical protein
MFWIPEKAFAREGLSEFKEERIEGRFPTI